MAHLKWRLMSFGTNNDERASLTRCSLWVKHGILNAEEMLVLRFHTYVKNPYLVTLTKVSLALCRVSGQLGGRFSSVARGKTTFHLTIFR